MRRYALATVILTFVVVVVGAYVRLSDAGLGCPDWPLCYGRPVPDAHEDARAWKEMGHRYLAGTLGLMIFGLMLAAWRQRAAPRLATAIALLVVFQATLGKWTVTMLLKPAIVVSHLAGGMTLLALLVWFYLQRASPRLPSVPRAPAVAALAVVGIQILLGGWVSANYAALACPDLPLCLGQAVPQMDFGNAFHVLRELGRTDEGELLPHDALVAIQWSHRVFALIVVATVGFAAGKTWKVHRPIAAVIAGLLLLQFSLGVANVAFNLPLALAAAHNAGGAALLAALVVLNFSAFRDNSSTSR
jgi:heme a synthase